MRRSLWRPGALLLLVGGAGALFWGWGRTAEESPWGVVWAEGLGDGQAVLVWENGDRARISRVSLADGRPERTLEEEGALTVLAKTPGVLWVRSEGGIMAVELPALVRHRVEGTLRSDPRLANYQRAVGTTVDRLVLVNERDERFAVSVDGSIERVEADTPLEPAFDVHQVRTPTAERGPWEGLRAQDLPLARPAFLVEGGRPVTPREDLALVVAREGSGPSETHEVAAVARDGTVRWRAPALVPAGRVIWVSSRGERLIALARRLVPAEGEGEARWLHRSELVRVDPDRGPTERVVLSPGEP